MKSVEVEEKSYDFGIQVVLPLEHGVKCGRPRAVRDHQRSHRLPVVDARHVAIALLSYDTNVFRLVARLVSRKDTENI